MAAYIYRLSDGSLYSTCPSSNDPIAPAAILAANGLGVAYGPPLGPTISWNPVTLSTTTVGASVPLPPPPVSGTITFGGGQLYHYGGDDVSGGWPSSPEWSNPQASAYSTSAARPLNLTITTTANNVKNAYTQLIAATVGDAQMIDVQMGQTVTAIFTSNAVDIAVGAAGVENVIINSLAVGQSGNQAANNFRFPINIPSGSRIAARFALSSSTTTSTAIAPSVGIQIFDGGMTAGEGFAGVDAIGQINGVGTTLTSTAANVYTPYAQLTAATTRDYAGFVAGTDNVASNVLLDVAVGAGGSEKNMLTRYYMGNGIAGLRLATDPIMTTIPSGSRIAARADYGAAGSFNVSLYGIYV